MSADLRAAVERGKALGHRWVQLVVRRPRPPKDWDRVRIIPGCYGKAVGPLADGAFLVDVELADLDRALQAPGVAEKDK